MYTPGKLNNGEVGGIGDEGEDGYGFGWGINYNSKLGLVVDHSGGWPGYFTWLERFADADRVLILLCSRDVLDGKCYDAFLKDCERLQRTSSRNRCTPLRSLLSRTPTGADGRPSPESTTTTKTASAWTRF